MGALDNRVVMISGTGGGQGRSAALLFAAEGAKVFGCDINKEGDAETVAMVRDAGGEMTSVAPADLSSAEGAQAWIDSGVETYGGCDVLYNNASSARVGPFDAMELEDWHHTIRNELDIVYFSTRAAWPYLIKADKGVVINIASLSATQGSAFVGQAAHGAAKGGVLAFTKHVCAAGAEHGIRAVSISPGLIRTPATAPFIDNPPPQVTSLIANTPARRVGQPEDIANVALFLASDNASFINGADIIVDGGLAAVPV